MMLEDRNNTRFNEKESQKKSIELILDQRVDISRKDRLRDSSLVQTQTMEEML